jgi:hypothetical protein
MSTRNHAMSTPSGALNRLPSHSVPSAAHVEWSSRARSGSISSLPPIQAMTFAENPSISVTGVSDSQSLMGGSLVSDHANRPLASNSNHWNTADIV